jgi:hypothetical protein
VPHQELELTAPRLIVLQDIAAMECVLHFVRQELTAPLLMVSLEHAVKLETVYLLALELVLALALALMPVLQELSAPSAQVP